MIFAGIPNPMALHRERRRGRRPRRCDLLNTSHLFYAPLLLFMLLRRCPVADAFVVLSGSGQSHAVRLLPLRDSIVSSLLKTRLSSRNKKNEGLPKPKVERGDEKLRTVPATSSSVISIDFLTRATREALHRQNRILLALDEQEGKLGDDLTVAQSVRRRRDEVRDKSIALRDILTETEHLVGRKGGDGMLYLSELKGKLVRLGFQGLLERGEEMWTGEAEAIKKEFGRPSDFRGLVFNSPQGVPILVGRDGAHGDEVLRRVSQGTDLWFQVEDYAGSRVLLRTSLVRGMRDSRSCKQFAADLAAYYSSYRDWHGVPVMYTDSRKVAKRGPKAGQMRKRKSLGKMLANPSDVADIASGREHN